MPQKNDLGAFDRALLILARRAHSTAELRRKLRQRRHAPEEVEAALARLLELGYLDDAAFARSLVDWRSKSRGRRALAAELAARGVARDVATAALTELDGEFELEAARRLVSRLGAGTSREELARAAGRLRRRGFGESTVRSVLRDFGLPAPG